MRPLFLLIAAIVIGAALTIIWVQPDTMLVERSTSITAPQLIVFQYINDLHRWETWSPWAPLDPNMQSTYAGASNGVGATYLWKGNSKVGEGKMVITETIPNEQVSMHLDFYKPFASSSEAVFTMKAADAAHTLVSWTMQSENNFLFKALSLVMNMDGAIGQDFERGLASLKKHLEPQPANPAGTAAPAH